MVRIFATFFILFCLCSCGFRTLHSAKAKQTAQLEKINIEPLDTIAGSEYYEAIYDLLRPGRETKYKLLTTLNFSKGISVLLPNSDILHEKITAEVQYHLILNDAGVELTSGNIRKTLSYSTTFAPYTNNVRAEDATLKLARHVAEEVRNRLLFYFINTHEDIQQ